jgi:hypothetical protein
MLPMLPVAAPVATAPVEAWSFLVALLEPEMVAAEVLPEDVPPVEVVGDEAVAEVAVPVEFKRAASPAQIAEAVIRSMLSRRAPVVVEVTEPEPEQIEVPVLTDVPAHVQEDMPAEVAPPTLESKEDEDVTVIPEPVLVTSEPSLPLPAVEALPPAPVPIVPPTATPVVMSAPSVASRPEAPREEAPKTPVPMIVRPMREAPEAPAPVAFTLRLTAVEASNGAEEAPVAASVPVAVAPKDAKDTKEPAIEVAPKLAPERIEIEKKDLPQEGQPRREQARQEQPRENLEPPAEEMPKVATAARPMEQNSEQTVAPGQLVRPEAHVMTHAPAVVSAPIVREVAFTVPEPKAVATAVPVEPPAEPVKIAASAPLQEIALRVSAPERAPVDVHVAGRGAEVRVVVRTADEGLQTVLREDLSSLVRQLEKSGFRAEPVPTLAPQAIAEPQSAFRSGDAPASFDVHAVTQAGAQMSSASQSEEHGAADSGSRQQQQHPQQQQHQRRPQSAWDEVFESMEEAA